LSADRTIFVWGMTGVGKSTVGPLLAARLGVPCVDLDARVERRAARSIADIFATEGEPGFRQREGAALDAICADDRPQVVVLGGGALVRSHRRQQARRAGLVIGLSAELETVAARLAGATDRPLLDGADRLTRLRALHAARACAYADVDLAVETDGLTPDGVVDRIVRALGGEVAA